MNQNAAHTVGIIGVGPRGLSVLERMVENAREHFHEPIVVHLFESREFGPGEVWRTDQSPDLIMNIVASQITAYPDRTVRMAGPIREGPSLHEWSLGVAAGAIEDAGPPEVLAEAAGVDANSYCRRSYYGHYLRWAYAQIVRGAPPGVEIREHRRTVLLVADTPSGRQAVTTDLGHTTEVDELVLATGHGPVVPSAAETAFRAFADRTGGRYYPPANPADVDLGGIEPGRPLLMRGLGLSFFDYMALLTQGRGGRYTRTAQGLRYHPSGNEPRIVCGSRRGVPLHGRADNEKGAGRHEPVFLTEARIEELRERAGGPLDFRRDCWPLIAKEVETVYYTRLLALRASEETAQEFSGLYAAAPWGGDAERVVLRKFKVPEERRWNWTRVARPWTAEDIATADAWRTFLRSHLLADVREARRGNVTSPLKSAVDVVRDIRNEMRFLMNNGGIEGHSYRTDVEGWFNSLHAFLSLGPPWSRVEELIALMDAGVVTVAGPGFTVAFDPAESVFTGSSRVPGDLSKATALMEARLPEVDLTRTRNTVLAHLREQRQVKNFSLLTAPLGEHRTGGVAVTRRPYRAVREDGSVHPRRYVFGVPTEGANWITETGIRPFVNSITVGDSDSIARAVLRLTDPPAPHPAGAPDHERN
ncbi:FAD/NAD(P)-binding protein [Streptomyces sp. NPDC014894]|uniref:FAD/NAD(P)-binding protein n=1 Tax=Streptomyces sp. NPDC014894 TaxID=3364931 RepID=UPI0037013C9D